MAEKIIYPDGSYPSGMVGTVTALPHTGDPLLECAAADSLQRLFEERTRPVQDAACDWVTVRKAYRTWSAMKAMSEAEAREVVWDNLKAPALDQPAAAEVSPEEASKRRFWL